MTLADAKLYTYKTPADRFVNVSVQCSVTLFLFFMKTVALLTAAGAVLLVSCTSLRGGRYLPSDVLNRSVDALERLFEFLVRYNDTLLPDALFGVVLARSQLETLLRGNPRKKFRNDFVAPLEEIALYFRIRDLEKICNGVIEDNTREGENSTLKYILDSKLWKIREPLKAGKLLEKEVCRWEVLEMYRQVLDIGTNITSLVYDESTDDVFNTCIMELLRSSDMLSTCDVSPNCWEVDTDGQLAAGYSVVHRLLFIQLARQIGCTKEPFYIDPNIRSRELCTEILTESETIDLLGFPQIFVDLFFEQVILCGGVEGYIDFLRLQWMNYVMSLQGENGCYGVLQENDNVTDDVAHSVGECSMRRTGLAAAVLATNIRALVEFHSALFPIVQHL